MKLTTNYPTLTYTEGDYIIDIVYNEDNKEYESWLHHKDYGVKLHMFSMSFDRITYEEFVNTLVSDALPRYIRHYKREVIKTCLK